MRGACALPAAAFSVWCSPDELLLAPVVGKRLGSPGCSQRGNDALGKLPAVCVVGFNLLDDAEISGGPHSLSTGCLCQQNSTSVSVGSSALGETCSPQRWPSLGERLKESAREADAGLRRSRGQGRQGCTLDSAYSHGDPTGPVSPCVGSWLTEAARCGVEAESTY